MIRGTRPNDAPAGYSVVAYASCTCGWSTYRGSEYSAQSAAEVHAAGHRARGEAVRLPLAPIRARAAA